MPKFDIVEVNVQFTVAIPAEANAVEWIEALSYAIRNAITERANGTGIGVSNVQLDAAPVR